MEFAYEQCGMKFYEESASETHADYCWKLSAADKESKAQSLYDSVERFEREKKLEEIADKKKDRGRSKTPKNKESTVTRKRSTMQQSPQKRKSGAVQKPENTKPKDFTNKPVTKKYPLRSNKEIEDVEKLLAKYKTTNKKLEQTKGKVESSTDVSRSFEELDDTKNDSNYDPDNSTSGSSERLTDNKIQLPTIRRPKTQSMKTEKMAKDETPKSPVKSSDAFEIIQRKHKTANAKDETRENQNKKKAAKSSQAIPTSTQIRNEKNQKAVMNKSQISVKKQAGRNVGVTTRSGAAKSNQRGKDDEISDDNKSDAEVTCYTCNICEQTFKHHLQYKTHKITCTKIPKKFV